MQIPNWDIIQFTDKEGKLTSDAQNLMQQLFRELQANFSQTGLGAPHAHIDTINTIASRELRNNSIIRDNTDTGNTALKFILDGNVKTFTLT